MGAESQNTGYTGKMGHEKKFHKTHFSAIGRKLKSKKKAVWVEIAPGRYKLAKGDQNGNGIS